MMAIDLILLLERQYYIGLTEGEDAERGKRIETLLSR